MGAWVTYFDTTRDAYVRIYAPVAELYDDVSGQWLILDEDPKDPDRLDDRLEETNE